MRLTTTRKLEPDLFDYDGLRNVDENQYFLKIVVNTEL